MLTALRRSISSPRICVGLRQTRSYARRPELINRVNSDKALYIGGGIGLAIGAYWVSHIESAPETKRRRFMWVSKEEEDELRKQALEETLRDYQDRILPENHPLTQQVRRITRRILTASNLGYLHGDVPQYGSENFDLWNGLPHAEIPQAHDVSPEKEWVVLVVNDRDFVNAFAAPGLVCVSTGIMPIAQNEEGLASVIGHEIGHVVMRHSAEHLSKLKLLFPIIGFMWLLGVDPLISSSLTRLFYFLPNSRALETEADIVGLRLMSRACYDPAAAPAFFERMQLKEGVHVPEFLSTHPPTPGRIAHLRTLLPENHDIYHVNPECARLEEMRARGIIGRQRMFVEF